MTVEVKDNARNSHNQTKKHAMLTQKMCLTKSYENHYYELCKKEAQVETAGTKYFYTKS